MKQPINWSLLQNVANPIADLITSNKNAAYAKQVFGSGAVDWNEKVRKLLAAGDVAGAAKVAAIAHILEPNKPKTGFNPVTGQLMNMETGEPFGGGSPTSAAPYKEPPKFRYKDPNNPDAGQEFVPGGAGDPSVIAAQRNADLQSKALIAKPQASLKIGTLYDTMDRLAARAEDIKNDPHLWQATGSIGAIPAFPGSKSADVTAKIDALKAQAGMAALSAMREASKTGGAVGQVSNFEQQLFQQQMAAINTAQSPAEFRKAMDDLIAYTQAAKARSGTAFQEQYGEEYTPNTTAQAKTPQIDTGTPVAPGAVYSPTGNARPIPSPDKLQILKRFANNPDARAAFDEIYGPGAADHFLQGGQ